MWGGVPARVVHVGDPHHLGGLDHRSIFVDGDDGATHDFAHLVVGQVFHHLLCALLEERTVGRKAEVPLRHDAHHLLRIGRLHDGQAMDSLLEHHAQDHVERSVRVDGEHWLGHHIPHEVELVGCSEHP